MATGGAVRPEANTASLAGQLGVSQPYICKVAKRWGSEGMAAMLANPEPVTFENLARAGSRADNE